MTKEKFVEFMKNRVGATTAPVDHILIALIRNIGVDA